MCMGGLALGSAWLFHSQAITPLKLREDEFVRRRAELREHLDSGREKLIAIKESEQKVGEARAALNRLVGGKKADSSMVSFPEEMKEQFSRFGLPSAIIRLITAEEEPDLPGYRKVYWSVGLPIPKTDRNVEGLLQAVADLEERDRYLKVTDFALQPDVVDPSLRTASVSIVILDQK